MFKRNRNVKESTIETMKAEAIAAGDYGTVRKLMEIEAEMERKVLSARLKGIFSGYGTAMAGITIGRVVSRTVRYR